MILKPNIEHRGSTPRLPILVLPCSKGSLLERVACQTGWKFGLLRPLSLLLRVIRSEDLIKHTEMS